MSSQTPLGDGSTHVAAKHQLHFCVVIHAAPGPVCPWVHSNGMLLLHQVMQPQLSGQDRPALAACKPLSWLQLISAGLTTLNLELSLAAFGDSMPHYDATADWNCSHKHPRKERQHLCMTC